MVLACITSLINSCRAPKRAKWAAMVSRRASAILLWVWNIPAANPDQLANMAGTAVSFTPRLTAASSIWPTKLLVCTTAVIRGP